MEAIERLSADEPLANRTLANGLRLLEHLASSARAYAVAELAREMDLPKSHVHRLLQTLVSAGYVVQDPETRRYRIDFQVFLLAAALAHSLPLRRAGGPPLRDLATRCKAGAGIFVWHRGAPMTVMSDGYQGRQVGAFEIGNRMAVHCTASGKLFAALLRLDPAKLALPRITERTITDPKAFARELETIRAQGYSVNRRENTEKLFSFAAPVFGLDEQLEGAVGVAIPRAIVEHRGEAPYIEAVLETAEAIHAALAGITREPLAAPVGS